MGTPARGDRVGKYEVLAPLTSGGMAELFLGSTMGPGGFQKHVVIKRILPDASRDETFMRMFLDEARITAGFSHPNIAQVYDLGEDEQGLYVVMEYIAGQNLNQVVSVCAKRQQVLPLGFSVSVVNDCALALHYAHTWVKPTGEPYSVIHRDVAQKNIMVGWDGQTKLLDFGIAKAAGTLSRTKVGTVKGTAGYMSPEQVRGLPIDARSDVFALGVVAWEMVTGQRLFTAETELAEMQLVLTAQVERPDDVEPVVPEALADVIMRALAKEPADRWPSAKEFSRALVARCPELITDQEVRSAFMRELFADRIEQTRKLFEVSSKQGTEGEEEVRRLAKSLQESAMSQPSLKPVRAKHRRGAKARARATSVEDEKLLELAIKVDQVAAGAEAQAPKRTWGPLVMGGLVVLLGLAVANRVLFPEPRVSSSSGLVLWDDQEPDETPPSSDALPSAQPGAIPGAVTDPPREGEPEAPNENAGTPAIPIEPEPPKKDPTRPAPRRPVVLYRLVIPEGAKVFLGKQLLAEGKFLDLKLPVGTHLLTLLGDDGLKRSLSVQVSAADTKSHRFSLASLPLQ